MRDVDKKFRSLPCALSLKVGDAVFRDDEVSRLSRRGYDGARRKRRNNKGLHYTVTVLVYGRRAEKTLTADGLKRAHDKIELSAGAAYLSRPYGFGTYLPVKIYLYAPVYGYEIIYTAYYRYVIDVIDRGAAAYRVHVYKIVKPLSAAGKRIYRFAPVVPFAAGELSRLEQIHI